MPVLPLMNDKLRAFAEAEILKGLQQLPEDWQMKFKLMYGRQNGKRPLEESKAMLIEDVIREVPDDRIDWAMQQVENSIKSLAKQNA